MEHSSGTAGGIAAQLSFRDLVGNMNLVAITLNVAAELTFCNEYFLTLTGWTEDEILGCNWFDRFVSPGTDDVPRVFAELLRDEPSAWHHENAILCRSGRKVLIRWNNSAVRSSSGEIVGIASIGEDVTEHRLLERELLAANARERERLAAEMHDGLGQQLYGAGLFIRGLETTAKKENLSITRDLSRLAEIIESSMETCRQIARGLSPLAEVDGSFVRAFRELARMPTYSGTQIKLTVANEAPLRMESGRLEHLFRMTQEALSNAVKHARATAVQVRLDIQPKVVTVTVADDGVGLPPNLTIMDGLGLKMMHYRARMMHAKLLISRAHPRGTKVTCACPQAELP